jgi:hypothetical protein
MRLLRALNENILIEVSDKVKKQLYTKFKNQTSDDEKTIMSYIDLFNKYKEGLDPTKRDITKYSYKDLKAYIDGKTFAKQLKDIFTNFKKKESEVENIPLKKYIKKFLEIQSELPEDRQDINKYDYLQLVELVDKVYDQVLNKKLTKKFSKENPNLTPDQILYYITDYITNFDVIPVDTKGVDKMSFIELEYLLDGLDNKRNEVSKKEDIEDIDLVYNQNNLKIFAPKTKDQCIRLKNGRGWCTSREGGGNMYYNYRLGNGRTLYYVIDEDKSFDDLNFATVLLVDRNGQISMADKSNSGRYGGGTNLPWDEIVSKVPKLEGLKDIFKPVPLTDEEIELINTVRNVRVGDNPMESFDNPQQVEMWLEYNSPKLSDIQYSNLIPLLKKKYIALGMDLSSNMISNSEADVLKYYISKKIDSIKNKDIGSLSTEDISLLNTPMLKNVKEELKPKFAQTLTTKDEKLIIDSFSSGAVGKFIGLYGLNDLFDSLPLTLTELQIYNPHKNDIIINIPESINKFKNLNALIFDNCVESVPDTICELEKLRFLALINNPKLTNIPECLVNLPNMYFLNLKGSPNVQIPEAIKQKGNDMGGGIWDLED